MLRFDRSNIFSYYTIYKEIFTEILNEPEQVNKVSIMVMLHPIKNLKGPWL